jgi:hypothetical protein
MNGIKIYISFPWLASVLTLLASLFLSTDANAQRIPLACQSEEVGGLHWESGRWILSKFRLQKFVLVQDGQTLTVDSVSKALSSRSATCRVNYGLTSCEDASGGFLFFSTKTRAGVVAQLLGAVQIDGSTPDSLTVGPFVCQAF